MVQVSRVDARYRAQVVVVDEAGVAHGSRVITSDGDSCEGLVDATALAISIALDASAASESSPAPAPSGSVTDTPPSEPPPPTPSATVDRDLEPPDTAEPARSQARRTWGFAGADVLASFGTEPGPAAGLAAFGGLRGESWSMALELRGDAPASTGASVGPGSVSSWSLLGGFVPCLHVLWLFVCGVGELGTIQGQGTGVAAPASGGGVFGFAGLRAGAEVALTPTVSLRARVEGLFDLYRPVLDLEGAAAWTAPPFASTVGVGVIVRLP